MNQGSERGRQWLRAVETVSPGAGGGRGQGGEVEMGTKPVSAQPTALAPGLCLRTETQEEVLTQRWLFRGLSVTPTLARPLSYL